MAAVSFMFVRLRREASDHVTDEQALATNRFEARLSFGLTLLFLAGSALGWFYPRLALVLFMATPVIKRIARLFGATGDRKSTAENFHDRRQ
jgi:hypothetical protein